MIEMNGKVLRNELLNQLKEKIENVSAPLGLCVIQVGEDEASKVYVGQKEKLALELGYKFVHKVFPSDVTQDVLVEYIEEMNNDETIDGILVQMPLPAHLDEIVIQNKISHDKDVDGLTYINAGKVGHNVGSLAPCTPKGIIDLLDNYGVLIEGANVVVIGRSILVGKPVANLLLNRNATVSICHSKTKDLAMYTKNADIVIVAVGKAKFLTADMIKDKSVVVDVGINRVDGKLCGDVDFERVSKKVSYITPVPGGVGPMTVYELMNNVYEAHMMRIKDKVKKLTR